MLAEDKKTRPGLARPAGGLARSLADKKVAAGVFVILVLGGLLFLTSPTLAVLSVTDISNGFIGAVAQLFLFLARLCMSITIFFLRLFTELAQYNGFIEAPPVVIGWLMVRDIANMFFVVALLVIAFGTILGLEQYEWKKTLMKLILAAIFINFSKLILQLLIDFAHVFTITFLNAIQGTAAGNLISLLHYDAVLKMTAVDTTFGADSLRGDLFVAGVMALVLTVIAMIAMGAYLFIMLARLVVLWVLIILSPLAFIASVLPNTKSYADEFWKSFTHHVLVAPLMVFFLWLTFATLGSGNIASEIGIQTSEAAGAGAAIASTLPPNPTLSLSEATTWENFASFLIAIGFMVVGIAVVQKLGVVGGGAAAGAVSFGKKVAMIASGAALGIWAARSLVDEGAKFGKSHTADTYGKYAKGNIKLAKEKALHALSKTPIIGAIVRTPKRLAKRGAIAEETAEAIADIRGKEIASGEYGVERSRYRGQLQTLSLRSEKRDRERDTREAVEFAKTNRWKDGKQVSSTIFQEIGGHEVAAAGVESEKKELEQQAESEVVSLGRAALKAHQEKKAGLDDSLKIPKQKGLETAIERAAPGLKEKTDKLQQNYDDIEAAVRDGADFKNIPTLEDNLEKGRQKLSDIEVTAKAKVKLEGEVDDLQSKKGKMLLDGIAPTDKKITDVDAKILEKTKKIKKYDDKLQAGGDKSQIQSEVDTSEAQLEKLKSKLAAEVAGVVEKRREAIDGVEKELKVQVDGKELSVAEAREQLGQIEETQKQDTEYEKKRKAVDKKKEELDEEFIRKNTTQPKIVDPKTGEKKANPLYASIKYIYGHAAAATATAEREQAAGLLEVDAHQLSPIETIIHNGIAAEVGSEAAKKFVEGIKSTELKNKFKEAGDTILKAIDKGAAGLKEMDQSEDTYIRALRQTKLSQAETEDAGVNRADAEAIAGGVFVEAKAQGYSTPSAALVNVAKRLGDGLRKLDQPGRADKATKNFANLAGLRAKGEDIGIRERAYAFGTLHNLVDEANVDDHLGDVVKKFKRLDEKPDTFKPEERASLEALKEAYKALGVIQVKDGKFNRSLNSAESMNRIQNWVLSGGDTGQIEHHIKIQEKMKELGTDSYRRGMNEYFKSLKDGAQAQKDFVKKLKEQETLLTDASQDFINAAKQSGHLQNGGHQQFDSDLGLARYATVDESVKTMIGQVIKNQGLGRKLNFQSFGDVDADSFVLTRVDERMAAAALGKVRTAAEGSQVLDRTVDTLTGYRPGGAASGNRLGGSAADLQKNFGGAKNFVRDVLIPQLIGSPEALAIVAHRKFGNVNKLAAERGVIDISVDGDEHLQQVNSIAELINKIKANIGDYVDSKDQQNILAKLENSLDRASKQQQSGKTKREEIDDDEEYGEAA